MSAMKQQYVHFKCLFRKERERERDLKNTFNR